MLKALFFGRPQIYLGHTCITPALNQYELALFAYLTMTGEPQSRSLLAEMLWPNLSRWQAKKNLRYLLRSLHRRVGQYLTVSSKSVAFNSTAPYWLDVKVFIDHISSDSRFPITTIAPEILQQLVELYTDEFLAGFSLQDAPKFNQWVSHQRRYLHDLIGEAHMN